MYLFIKKTCGMPVTKLYFPVLLNVKLNNIYYASVYTTLLLTI